MARRQRVEKVLGVVGYCRCSTEEQAESGLGMAAQESAIKSECERRGVPLVALYRDEGVSAKNMVRPALQAALADLEAGQGTVLMVSKLDRLTRSVHDATGLMLRAENVGDQGNQRSAINESRVERPGLLLGSER
jgi:DNA invertase Pin-like site-specific DNA recombinase